MAKLKRRTQKERLREVKRFRAADWRRMFPKEVKIAKTLFMLSPKITRRMLKQERTQAIGEQREKKFSAALESLKKQRKICDYLSLCGTYSDFVKGIDFVCVLVADGRYRFFSLSVTGEKWVKEHREKHPEVPVISIDSNESIESVNGKILAMLRNGANSR